MSAQRPVVDGKFIRVGNERFWVRGVTYGAFEPNSRGELFPELSFVDRDFRQMRLAHVNTILTYTVPSIELLDLAHRHGMHVIVNMPWFDIDGRLERRTTRTAIGNLVRDKVRSCAAHPAVLLYCVGKELDPDLIRWYGAHKVQRLLRDLYSIAKDEDPEGLVSFTSFPTTEYLDLEFLDVCTYNVYLHRRESFCAYLSRLQHIAGELPLLLTEIGMCSFRHGTEAQAELIGWQLDEASDHGLAGAVVFGWTDSFYGDGEMVHDWGFGVVDDERVPKPSFDVVRSRFDSCPPYSHYRSLPAVTVIIAVYNAEATLRECLDSLGRLRYPSYEVLVVDDGSTDASAQIMSEFPYRVISQPNRGVSAARNAGLDLACGDIVAYMDADARADPDWLGFLVATMQETGFEAAGGPNLLPPEDEWIARLVYRSPGGPTHVMLDDTLAEHVPGCNMAFRREILRQTGGFDPVFTAAGDDVDICWRLMEGGHRIAFSPGAVVWHHRRTSFRAYWKQQVGYGMSEGLLEKKHPNKYNSLGHALWDGRIYGSSPEFCVARPNRVYHGLWGTAPFQHIYDKGKGGMLDFLPRTAEWYAILLLFLAASTINPIFVPLPLLGFGYSAYYFLRSVSQVRLQKTLLSRMRTPWRMMASRVALTLLYLIEPVARYWGRARSGLLPWRGIRNTPNDSISGSKPSGGFNTGFVRSIDRTEIVRGAVCKSTLLRQITSQLKVMGCAVHWNPATEPWDIRVRRGALTRATSRIHISRNGKGAQAVRLGVIVAPTSAFWLTVLCLVLVLATALLAEKTTIAIAVGIATVITLVLSMRETARIAYAISWVFYESLNGWRLD